jgi:tripartite-type tricarboxylate transporter receptor subunit TctC
MKMPTSLTITARRLGCALGLVLAGVACTASSAQTTRTIRIVVPAPAGGAGDILTRLLSEQVNRTESASIITENRPGAGTILGTEAVARAAPDGNTLLITAPYLLIAPQVKKVSYDPLTSFEPICYLVSSPGIIVVNSASPYRTISDFLAAARERPGSVTIASAGPATTQHIGIEMLRRSARADLTYVPFAGGAPAINALLGGHVTAVLAEYAPLAEHIKAGTLRAVATTARTRIELLPDVPTVAESGYPGYEVDLWWGLFAPAKTPSTTVAQLGGWFTAAMQAPSVKARLVAQGFAPVATCGADFAALLRKQYDEYGRVIRDAKIGE